MIRMNEHWVVGDGNAVRPVLKNEDLVFDDGNDLFW